MKLVEIARGYMELEKLAEERLPLKISYHVNKMMEKLEHPFRFYASKELELVQKYKPVSQEGTSVRFANEETTVAFNNEHNELDEIDEELMIRPIRIDIGTDVHLTGKSLKTLMSLGIVEVCGAEEEESGVKNNGQQEKGGCAC